MTNYNRIREEFTAVFPTGGFSTCDFRPHFDGFGHNAWVVIQPEGTAEFTRRAAYAWMAEMVDALRPFRPLFGGGDRIQFAVVLPAGDRHANRRILKGWFPASRLVEVVSPNFAAVGGEFGESDDWSDDGLWN